jgi:aarF domain-containing kinase
MHVVFPSFDLVWLAEETRKNLPIELDFINEGKNAEKVAVMLKKFSFVKIPKIYWKFTSDRVLTMEYCEGGRVDDVKEMKKNNVDVNMVN